MIAVTADGSYSEIPGATLNTYTPVAGDASKFIKVVATGTGSYSGTMPSAATDAITIPVTPLAAIGAITGTPQVGSVLTAGALTPAGATATYQWMIAVTADGSYSDIPGATLNTYTPVAGDASKFIKVVATGTGSYSGTMPSAATAAVTTPVTPLTAIGAISGTPQVGSMLTAGALTPAGATASYQWKISATVGGSYADIGGATSNTYTPVAGDAGKFIKVAATGTGSYSGTVTSSATAAVTTPVTPLTAIGAITGTPQVGSMLTAGVLTPAGASASYQWKISATVGGSYADIGGATSNTYTPVAGDATKFIKVAATGTGSYSGTVTSAATLPVTETTSESDFQYIDNGATITITKYIGSGGAVNIPGTINGKPVTSIGDQAFYNCTSLTSVTIPNSVTSIGLAVFYACPSLMAITVDALNSAYSSLDGVLFNKSQTMLIQCPLGKPDNYTIPSSVISISNGAFERLRNPSLTSITIPSSVTSIGNDAFNDCLFLTEITVNALNPIYSSSDGVLFNKSQTTLIQCPGGKAGSYTVPNSVTNIGDGSFFRTSLASVTLPDSVTNIGNMAFYDCCFSLYSITLGNFVTNIGDYSFCNCTNLTGVTIPDSVTSIGYKAFASCSNLTGVTIPDSVTSIGYKAFASCSNLSSVAFLGDAQNMSSDVFYGNKKVIVYYLPGKTGWKSTFCGRPTALIAWVPGAFNGYAQYGGTASMTVSALGKITGKVVLDGKNYTFSAASYETGGNVTDGFTVTVIAKAGREEIPLTLKVTNPAGVEPPNLSVVEGWFSYTIEGDPDVKMYRNVWKETDMEYKGYYTAVLPGGADYGSGYLTLTVDNVGAVKTTGKLADGTALSLSSMLILDETGRAFTVIYTSPSAYKTGCLFGIAEFVKAEDRDHVFLRTLDGVPFIWENRNPQAAAEYGKGFDRELGLSGGWYDKTGNLYAYYQGKELSAAVDAGAADLELTVAGTRYTSTFWNFSDMTLTPVLKSGAMTGLAVVPKAGLPVNLGGNSWNYDAENTEALTMGLTRATGIFKGSFKAWFDYVKTHTSKSISYEGVLTPEREDKTDGAAGRGFFLWADPSPGYPFKWSYDFLINEQYEGHVNEK
jgi:hypothetical protein